MVCLGTLYIGQLRGVGKVWQITTSDAACFYCLAGLLLTHTAGAVAHSLRRLVIRAVR